MSFLSDMTLDQSEIDIVFDALHQWCDEHDIALDSADGRDVATVMLALYKTGHDTTASIFEAMRTVSGT